jgi:hypothetical protein
MRLSRRAFLGRAGAAGAGLMLSPPLAAGQPAVAQGMADEPAPPSLAETFADLPRHFIFEYYPWYATDPWDHWNGSGRVPPIEIAANYMPALGPYDSKSIRVMEQHARWIRQSGVGAINVSWWGRGTPGDRLMPDLMDVMAEHDVHVAFHIEPYARERAASLASDVAYLLREYGERRRWDCFLLLANADGRSGPVFKTFSTIEGSEYTDCHGRTFPIPDWVRDEVWREQIDRVRTTFRHDFDHVTLLADCSAVDRVAAAGFDGMAIYDNYVEPDTWPIHAGNFGTSDLLFSFNVNPGFDALIERVPPNDCYRPPDFMPGRGAYDWTRAEDRRAAERLVSARIEESLAQTIALQLDPRHSNAQRGFFAAYINSFNEWHEGTQFEPAKDRSALAADELAVGYHNYDRGSLRLEVLRDALRQVTGISVQGSAGIRSQATSENNLQPVT